MLAALIYGAAAYTRPHEPAGRALHNIIDPAITRTAQRVKKLPIINLLDWDGVNDYQPRPALRPLEVVSPAVAGYTPEELAEIYPSH